MSIFVGSLGRLVRLKCAATQQVQPQDRFSFERTLEGRVKAQAVAVGRRVWSVATSDATDPAQQSAILAFTGGAWGPGPFVFVSEDAPVTNLLSPEQASCDPSLIPISGNVMAGGPVLLPDGWEARSLLNASPTSLMGFGAADIPIVPGQPLTVSAWVKGAGAAVRLVWLNDAGGQVLEQVSAVTGTASGWTRSFVTGVPPASAVRAQLQAVNTSAAARPAATWTERMFDWAAGEGCQKAVVHGLSKNLVMASREFRGGRYASMAFTVTEVG